MGKSVRKTNYYVTVFPGRLGNLGPATVPDNLVSKDPDAEYRRLCRTIVEQIKHHVDDIGQVYIEHDSDDVCEFCGAVWTEDGSQYNGGCCDKDTDIAAETEAHRHSPEKLDKIVDVLRQA